MVYPRALLFILFINDLPLEDGLDLLSLFADDATKSTASSSDKTKIMVIGTSKRLQYLDANKYKLNVFLGKSKIKQVTEEK